MRHSSPGKKLNPLISVHTARIFGRDNIRYLNLCRWVWYQQSKGWPDEAIAGALSLADSKIDSAHNWWAYLNGLLPKAKGRASEQEAQNYKTEVGHLADEFLAFVKSRRATR